MSNTSMYPPTSGAYRFVLLLRDATTQTCQHIDLGDLKTGPNLYEQTFDSRHYQNRKTTSISIYRAFIANMPPIPYR